MSSGGFTEADQARIAEEVQAHVRSSRVGLGFATTGDVEKYTPAKESSFSRSSAWVQQARDATQPEGATAIRDTTEGAFPWDGGSRGKVGGAGRTRDSGGRKSLRRASEEPATEGRTQEREFPMIRERDIEGSMTGRDAHRSRSTSRNRERERKGRSRSDRSRSRSRERCRSFRRRERTRETDLHQERDRERTRSRDWRHRRGRSSRSRDRPSVNKSRDRDTPDTRGYEALVSRRDSERTPTDQSPAATVPESKAKKASSMPTAKQAKAAVKHRLKEAVAGDATLKTGFKASLGGGGGWERPEMAEAADFFKSDEVAAKGGVASVAPEYAARVAEIRAIEDEDIMCLGDGSRKQLTAVDLGTGGTSNLDPLMQEHHDAIFAPRGSSSKGRDSSASSTPSIVPHASGVNAKSSLAKHGSSGVVGAAARARLALKGKLTGETRDKKLQTTPTKLATQERRAEQPPTNRHQEEQPLFKTLRVGDPVEARYTVDDKWYPATIHQVIHGGFEIARYKIRYPEYGNEETISWTRIRRVESPEPQSALSASEVPSVQAADPPSAKYSTPGAGVASSGTQSVEPTDVASVAFAGLRPRSLGVDHNEQTQRLPEQNAPTTSHEAFAHVVNPGLLSLEPGKKLSWKEKLQARKAGAAESGADGASTVCKKTISLVPDYAAQRKLQDVDKSLDKSEWRSKVVFGMRGSKGSNRS